MSSKVVKMPIQTSSWPKTSKLCVKVTKKLEKSPTKRPETATLEKPLVLDPRLIRKLDMTKFTREKLLSIQNIILSPKLRKKKSFGQNDWIKEESTVSNEPGRISKGINSTYRIRTNVRKGLSDLFTTSVKPPLSRLKITEKEAVNTLQEPIKEKKKNLFKTPSPKQIGSGVNQVAVPPPCCTCGRPEQPERLHSHPTGPQNRKTKSQQLNKEQENIPQTPIAQPKNSVRKPNPIKYRSVLQKNKLEDLPKVNRVARNETFRIIKNTEDVPSLPKQRISHIPVIRKSSTSVPSSPAKSITSVQSPSEKISPVVSPRNEDIKINSPKRPRTMVCYICMREFGTASLQLHEPHCLQRWERENLQLPRHLQRSPPQRPDRPLTPDEWNEFAYSAVKASLIPCGKCGRTFQPDRLPVHTKVCIGIQKKVSGTSSLPSENNINKDNSSIIYGREPCYLCGWMFSSNLLPNHEEACLAKWQSENDKLPFELQRPLPLKPGQQQTSKTFISQPSRRRLVICYICGREFGSASIRIHEPQCLKKWKIENEKLPSERRRHVPQKPRTIYKSDGEIDIPATDEVFWKSHLVQLVPCEKCGRKFNPGRVIVHEKACKGQQVKH